MERIRRIGLMVNFYKEQPLTLAKKLIGWLEKKGIEVYASSDDAVSLGIKPLGKEAFVDNIDAVIVIGGDGTLLRAGRYLAGSEIPILGINQGYLGFLTEIEVKEIDIYLEALLDGEYHLEKRMMLSAKVKRKGKILDEATALNDVVITKASLARLIGVDIYLEDQLIDGYLGDGVILATPTGSTAYSLSAGGPIVYPDLDVHVLTPICPHSLTARSIVIPPEKEVKILIKTGSCAAMLTVDGQSGVELENGDEVIITRAPWYTYLIKVKDKNFFEIMREKLKGVGNDKH